MEVFSGCSRADNSVVDGPIWPKFELMQDIMYVCVTSNFKKDRSNSCREKKRHHLDTKEQLTMWGVPEIRGKVS